ncbi:glycosyltransferase family 4 protein [Paraburkholderia mimosarum]|uniref:glycosyltransferase family 4 protein n=1 Tax=Paraburkholderia mimosarum TaxID=312026 RepID=UPI0039C3ED40
MNFLFFTPVNEASAIARVSCLVTQELVAQGHHVIVVATDRTPSKLEDRRDFAAEIVLWSDEGRITRESSQAHLCIYQIGDSYDFHCGAVKWLSELPGVVCLHDFYVAHLFHSWALEHGDKGRDILRRWYGESIESRFFEMARCSDFIEQTADVAPLTEWIASRALAVITHSRWGISRVQAACAGPIKVIPLPYSTTVTEVPEMDDEKDENRLSLLTVGHINGNKRVASVIRAIARSPSLRRTITYRLVGPISPQAVLELSGLANALGVRLLISGAVDDDALARAFAQADIVSCLRWPSLEAASASAIEAMLWRKPIIVTDTGFYREIPDAFVEKVSVIDEIPDICAALERLAKSPSERASMAERAWLRATETYSAENYARSLVDLAGSLQRDRPVAAARAFFANVLEDWKANPYRRWFDQTLDLPGQTI